jgi:hypothetical protein
MASGRSGGVARKIIAEEMEFNWIDPVFVPEDRGINPSNVEQVKKSSRYVRCKGLGRFGKHHNPMGKVCNKCWRSTRAWCTFDLKKQCIAHRWSKKCRRCKGESKPWFDEQALQKMAEYATKFHLSIGKPRAQNPKKRSFSRIEVIGAYPQIKGPPRYEVRYAKCRKLGRSCWKNSKHVYDDQEWLNIIPGRSLDDFNDDPSLMSEDEYYYNDDDDEYDIMYEEESDDDSLYYLYGDYEDTYESDNYSLYDPFGYYEYGDGDLYNSDGDPYDLCYPYWF